MSKITGDWLYNTAVRPDPSQPPAGYMRIGQGMPIRKGILANAEVDRPLIDIIHEATFSRPIGLQWVNDIYAFRTALRKAHCFTIDTATSALLADFSIAISTDLDSVRQLAAPPFPTTWFEIDNVARLRRIVELGHKLSEMASNDPVARVGWLITSHGDEYLANYCCVTLQGPVIAPMAYRWRTGARGIQSPKDTPTSVANNDRMCFNMKGSGVLTDDASITKAWPIPGEGEFVLSRQEVDLMFELSGELRYIFALLLTLGASNAGATPSFSPQAPSAAAPFEAKGKTLFPIEHKVLTIKLGRKMTADKVAARVISGHKKRFHEVRHHLRRIKTPDGGTRLVKVREHNRGDERLGKIVKTYRVEK